MRPGSLQAWVIALRPRSFAISASPVLVAVALTHWQTGAVDTMLAALAMVCAVLMQAITNLQNDVGFHQRGADASGQRQGLPRASTLGLLRPDSMHRAILALALLATTFGLLLFALRGWPVLVIGVASLMGALAYMGGPRPIAYTPVGELTVLAFFGWIAVLGTAWLLGTPPNGIGVLLASGVGCMAAAALAINNHRDRAHDLSIGRQTFAAMAGAKASGRLVLVLLWAPLLCVATAAGLAKAFPLLLPWLLAPRLWRLAGDFLRCPPGVAFNAILYRTFRMMLEFSLLLCLGLWWAQRAGLSVT